MKEDYEAHAQAQLASLKRDMRETLEDATVRAVNKVMAEFEAKSDERLMENAKGYFERINLVQTGVGIGKPEQGGLKNKCAMPEACPEHSHKFYAQFKEPQQEPVTYWDLSENEMPVRPRLYDSEEHPNHVPLYTTPPARKPLTHEQRVDLLAKFEAHKHEWHAPAILIDMVEAAHGIKGDA